MIEITQGSYGVAVAVVVSLRNEDHSLYIPDPASEITIKLKRRSDGYTVTGTCSLTTSYSVKGDEVTWIPHEGDTDKPGVYDVQWTVVNPDGEPIMFPSCVGPKSRDGFAIEICPKL